MVFERADEVVLPAVYNFVARSFNATPTQLATITLSRALVQALASPLGGILGECNAPYKVGFYSQEVITLPLNNLFACGKTVLVGKDV